MNKLLAKQSMLGRLHSASVKERRQAAEELWRYPGVDTAEELARALDDEDENVRWWAACTLGRLKTRLAVPALIRHATDVDEDAEVRRICLISLGEIGDVRATSHLLELLGDGSPMIQEHACQALGYIADPRAIPGLLRATKNQRWNVRWSAAVSLWRMHFPDVRDVLLGFVQDKAICEDLRAEIPDMLREVESEET